MVGGRSADFEDLDVAAALLGHAGEHEQKVFATDAAGATVGDEDAAGFEEVHRLTVHPVISHESAVHRAAAAGEFRRVEDDGIEAGPFPLQAVEGLESVGDYEGAVRKAVDAGIRLSLGDGLFAGV